MTVTRQHLPRRTVLRGLGATVALPLLDGMVPAFASRAELAATAVKRLGVVYVPMGVNVAKWTPPAEGALELSPILAPLEPFRDRVLVLSGLDSRLGDPGGGAHSRPQAAWLTGLTPRRTEGPGLQAGTSMDQIVANELGSQTQLASLEISLESVDFVGACEPGYSCAYTSTISWRTPTTPLPMEVNPRTVFERLFGDSESTDARARLDLMQKNRSILDSVTGEMARLKRGVGPRDQSKLVEYFDSLRDVERRIQKGEEQVARELPAMDQPVGIPSNFEEYARLMFDLLVLAYQCDLTRVSTFMLGRELSVRTFPEIGVGDSHHPLSHHQDSIEKLERQAKVNIYHMRLFSYFLEKLRATPDGDGSLLDHSLLLYGSSMSNSNVHLIKNLPTLVIGGPAVGIAGGRHVHYVETPITNLQLTLIGKMGIGADRFGDSTGTLDHLSGV